MWQNQIERLATTVSSFNEKDTISNNNDSIDDTSAQLGQKRKQDKVQECFIWE